MWRYLFILLIFALCPTNFLTAQNSDYDNEDSSYSDSYYDDYGNEDGYYDEDYDDYGGEDGYDEYYDDNYSDAYPAEQENTTNYSTLNLSSISSKEDDHKWLRYSMIMRGGYQASFGTKNMNGGVFEVAANMDITYVYFQIGLGWESYFANLGIEKYNAGGVGSNRSPSAFNNGWYMLVGAGFVIPEIGLRFGGGVQLSTTLIGQGLDIDYSDEALPYVDIFYELEVSKNVMWIVGMRSLLTGVAFVDYLPKSGATATFEIQTGFMFYFV